MFTETRRAITKLEYAANEIARDAGRPELYGNPALQWYRYPDEGAVQVVAVKAVRVASGLNAAFRLLEYDFAVEAAVILRTVDDFIDEITFLVEGHQRAELTRSHRDFLEHFFAESIEPEEEMMKDRRGPDRVKKKNIRASQARYLQADNPDRSRRIVQAIDHGLDGYVHGANPHSMELIDPNLSGGSFRMNGTKGMPYSGQYRAQLALYVSRAMSLFGMVALHLNRQVLKDELVTARNRFEASSEYPSDNQ